ncbi:MAG: xanthine dehydrogenase family protein subunit M [Armatimonadetes bacterium]|nr:xanthine dehydrogenase family protein subunit M [Anaerolineae bacterium]
MWPKEFEYVRASSIDEAVQLLAQHDNAKLIAGGHSLIPALKLRLSEPGLLIDIGRIPALNSISANGSLKIGALATHAEIAASPLVQAHAPALASAAGKIGDQAVRNFGTLGGNIAHADPASDPPTVLTACDAVIHLHGPNGARSVSAEAFFIDLFATDLQPNEIVTSIEIRNPGGMKSAYAKLSHPASRYAVTGVCVALQMSGGVCQSARVAVGGATVKAVRSHGAEAALVGKALDGATLDTAANVVMDEIADYLTGDLSFPQDYRQAMTGVYFKRAAVQAMGS